MTDYRILIISARQSQFRNLQSDESQFTIRFCDVSGGLLSSSGSVVSLPIVIGISIGVSSSGSVVKTKRHLRRSSLTRFRLQKTG